MHPRYSMDTESNPIKTTSVHGTEASHVRKVRSYSNLPVPLQLLANHRGERRGYVRHHLMALSTETHFRRPQNHVVMKQLMF